MEEITINVDGMHCPKCEMRIEKAVGALDGVESVKADHEAKTVVITCDGTDSTIDDAKAAIENLDFDVLE